MEFSNLCLPFTELFTVDLLFKQFIQGVNKSLAQHRWSYYEVVQKCSQNVWEWVKRGAESIRVVIPYTDCTIHPPTHTPSNVIRGQHNWRPFLHPGFLCCSVIFGGRATHQFLQKVHGSLKLWTLKLQKRLTSRIVRSFCCVLSTTPTDCFHASVSHTMGYLVTDLTYTCSLT